MIEAMIAFGMLMGLALGAAYIMSQLQKTNTAGVAKATAREIRQNVVTMLENEAAWLITASKPSNRTFSCLREAKNCHDGAPEDLPGLAYAVHDATGAVYYDGLDPKLGYSLNGAACRTFPSKACPFRMELTWRPICQPAPMFCLPSQIELSGRVIHEPGPSAPAASWMAHNPANYAFRLIKNLSSSGASVTLPPAVQKTMFCAQIAPLLKGQSPETIKQTIKNLGYDEDVYDQFMAAMSGCP